MFNGSVIQKNAAQINLILVIFFSCLFVLLVFFDLRPEASSQFGQQYQPSLSFAQLEKRQTVKHQATAPKSFAYSPPPLVPDYHLPAVPPGSLIPVYDFIPTTEKIVFLTIDDGVIKNPAAPELLGKYHVPADLFLNDVYVAEDPGYFKQLQSLGSVIQDHTIDHADLPPLSVAAQEAEICGDADDFASIFGKRPYLFRPPYGDYDDQTRQAAQACGMKALIMWHVTVNAGVLAYQDGNTTLQPGDIVLIHFRTTFAEDFAAFLAAANAAGLKPELLQNWLQPLQGQN